MSEHSGPSAWFSKDMDWGWRLQRPAVVERGLCRIRGPTGSHVLSVVCIALLPKATITRDNSNPIESEVGSLKG